jgi:hypothetical protein
MIYYNHQGRVYKWRDALPVFAERIWNAANPNWRSWEKQSDRMKQRFIADLGRHIADVRMFKSGGNTPP